ncbi:DUF2231 domain-containing protein [Actinoplanes sp. NPDC049681]|uniref:DUF2231 domain-containing protein n=1 Tax=Actinoplanes sp. NPDC049681 TaxID=3363905 RepID=UPI0037B2BF7A
MARVESGLEQAKRPVTGLAGPYGHPLHPALVAVPIGAWIASFVFDLASHLVHDAGFLAEGSRWLIGLGVLGALAAATVGFLDLFAIPTGTRAFRVALVHMALNLGVTVAYGIDFAIRGAHPPAPVPVGPLVLSGVALAALTASGYLGGELAYRYGVRVADEATQQRGYTSSTAVPPREDT